MLRFPPLLTTVVLACWLLSRFIKILHKRCPNPTLHRKDELTKQTS